MKRLFVLSVSILASVAVQAAGVTANSVDYSSYAWSARPCGVMLSVYAGPDTRGFSWQTDSSVTAGEVYVLEGVHGAADAALFRSSGRRVAATCYTGGVAAEKWSSPVVNSFVASVDKLQAGVTYSYMLGGADNYVYGSFVVKSADDSVVVVNLNDMQTKDASKYYLAENALKVAAETAGGATAVDFILDGGDFIDGIFRNAGNNSTTTDNTKLLNQWSMAADTATPYFPGVPWIHAAGNHDGQIYDYERSEADASRRTVMEDFRVNCSSLLGCHSFDYGNLHVTTIHDWGDTSWQEKHSRIVNWLKADLEASKANAAIRWRVVVMHKGPYTTGDNLRDSGKRYAENGFCKSIIQSLATLCTSNDVDLVLQAHDHTYSKTLPYRWSGCGYTTSETDAEQINLDPATSSFAGRVYDVNPEGTYYVSAGCIGHRVGELARYADRGGERSYTNRVYKVVTGKVCVDSPYAQKGGDASKDVGKQMFGVLRVDGDRLTYDFYVAETDGTATLFDTLGILKSTPSKVANAVDFSALPADVTVLDPRANDAGETFDALGSPVTNRFWSFQGSDASALAVAAEGVSGDGRCLKLATGDDLLFRNFTPLTSLDATDGLGAPVSAPGKGCVLYSSTVKFVDSNVLPTPEEVSADKLTVGVYGGALYAFGGYLSADGLELRAFRLDVPVSQAWLADFHPVVVRGYGAVSRTGTGAGFIVEVDGAIRSVVAVAPVEFDVLGTEVAAGGGYLGMFEPNKRFGGFHSSRKLLLGLSAENSFFAVGFQGSGVVDDVMLAALEKDILTRLGTLMVVR